MLPGVHRVRARSGRGVTEYWYAWRGGPRILQAKARSEALLAREIARLLPAATQAYNDAVRPAASDAFLPGLIGAYLESGALGGLAARTQSDIRKALDVVRRDHAELETQALDASDARRMLMEWRDNYRGHPRTADAYMDALARVITWAHARGDLTTNALKGWPRLYKVNRAEVIWEKPQLVKLLKGAEPHFRRAVLFAAFSGIRLSDLTGVTWANVGQDAITYRPSKGKRSKRVAVVPITPKLAAILRQIGRKDVGAVLTHSKGEPWTPWGLQTAMQRAKVRAGITGLRFHDLRGTAATHFVRAGLPIADVAVVLGWERDRVQALASYVTSEAVAAGMLERLRRNKSGARL